VPVVASRVDCIPAILQYLQSDCAGKGIGGYDHPPFPCGGLLSPKMGSRRKVAEQDDNNTHTDAMNTVHDYSREKGGLSLQSKTEA